MRPGRTLGPVMLAHVVFPTSKEYRAVPEEMCGGIELFKNSTPVDPQLDSCLGVPLWWVDTATVRQALG